MQLYGFMRIFILHFFSIMINTYHNWIENYKTGIQKAINLLFRSFFVTG